MSPKTVFLVSEPKPSETLSEAKSEPKPHKVRKSRKESKMATDVVNPIEVQDNEAEAQTSGVYKGKGNKKVMNPLTGKEEVRNGEFSLPLIRDEAHAKEILPNEEDRVFWMNQGRKAQARIQMYSLFEDIFGDEALNEAYESFILAYSQVVTDKTSEERKQKVRDFLLSEEKFEGLKGALEDLTKAGGLKPVSIDYAVEELKKPSGVRGKKAKAQEAE